MFRQIRLIALWAIAGTVSSLVALYNPWHPWTGVAMVCAAIAPAMIATVGLALWVVDIQVSRNGFSYHAPSVHDGFHYRIHRVRGVGHNEWHMVVLYQDGGGSMDAEVCRSPQEICDWMRDSDATLARMLAVIDFAE